MKYLQITTPTELDLRELFTLGLTSKRDGSKIGHKRSGMKFTLALLHRLGSHLIVRTSALALRSEVQTETIRGIDHRLIVLAGEAATAHDQPIATHIAETAGADTWTEPWFALRELVQNAIDEGGSVTILEEEPPPAHTEGTLMLVPLTAPFEAAWNDRDTWWHPRHQEIIYETPAGCGLYYHGFRVLDAQPLGWRWSYDVTGLIERDKLSEDRQLRNVNLDRLFARIAEAALPDHFYDALVDEMPKDIPPDLTLLQHAVYNAINSHNLNPGGFVLEKLITRFKGRHGERVAYSAYEDPNSSEHYFAKAAGYTVVYVDYILRNLLTYSDVPSAANVMPSLQKRLQPVRDVTLDTKSRLRETLRITRKLRPPGSKVRLVKPSYERDRMDASAWAVPAANEVLLLENFVEEATTERLVNALVEEYVHLSSGCSDGTVPFEKALIQTIVNLITPKRASVGLVF
jgi:hypothetical protein